MRRCPMFDSSTFLETMDLRLSPSSLLLGALHSHPGVIAEDHSLRTAPGWPKSEAHHGHLGVRPDDETVGDDPLPEPEPSPGTTTPVTYPQAPPSGPIAPGSS
jgi:hypothetical protein